LREILARSDHDFLFSEPRRTGRSRRSQPPRNILVRFLRLAQRAAAYPNRIAGGLIAALVVAISVNALELQQTRHPAPLFHKSFVSPATVAPTPRKPEPTPAAAPSDPIGQLLRTNPAQTAPATQPANEPNQDEITRLLQGDAKQIAPQPNKTVFAAQRALVKLGFVLKPDGIDGDATRQAIEQFERDHGLPVRDELNAKVLRELSQRSGIAID
jgi:uncharacterized NAD-dependent epimerase/dehydratase family protein